MNLSLFKRPYTPQTTEPVIVNFKDVPLNSDFEWRGKIWTKVSSKTAKIKDADKVYYFGMKDWCKIN